MSIPFSGTISSSGGLTGAIFHQLKKVNLKPVRKVTVKFDPFLKESAETRSFLFHITTRTATATNLNCKVKTEILCDRSSPSVLFNLNDGSSILMKSKHLTALELFQLVNKHITSLVPEEEPTTVVKTKSGKKASSRR